MDPGIIKSSFEKVSKQGEVFTRLFYAKLFERAPHVQPLFNKTQMN
jgi:hemoglobin-like flavoprotein